VDIGIVVLILIGLVWWVKCAGRNSVPKKAPLRRINVRRPLAA